MPDWLTDALRTFHREAVDENLREEHPTDVEVGDVCVLASFEHPPSAEPRLVVVIDANDDGTALVALASSDTALATDCDPILEPEQTALSYPLCVFTRFTATVWVPQIRRRLGALDDDAFDAVASLVWNPEQKPTIRTGTVLGPESTDDRWPILRAEADALDRLASHCERRRGELQCRVPLIDPAVLFTSPENAPQSAAPQFEPIQRAVALGAAMVSGASILRLVCRDELPGELFSLIHLASNQALCLALDGSHLPAIASAILDADDPATLRQLILEFEFSHDDLPVHRVTTGCRDSVQSEVVEINGERHLVLHAAVRDKAEVR